MGQRLASLHEDSHAQQRRKVVERSFQLCMNETLPMLLLVPLMASALLCLACISKVLEVALFLFLRSQTTSRRLTANVDPRAESNGVENSEYLSIHMKEVSFGRRFVVSRECPRSPRILILNLYK